MIATYHEVSLHELQLFRQADLGGGRSCAFYLVVVVVEPGDIDIGESSNLASGTSDTAADIEDIHALLQIHAQGQVVFMAGEGL